MFSSTDGCGQREPPPGTNPSFLFLIPWPSPLFSQHTWSSPDNKPFGVMVPTHTLLGFWRLLLAFHFCGQLPASCAAPTPRLPQTGAGHPAGLEPCMRASWPATGLLSPLQGWGWVGTSQQTHRPGPGPWLCVGCLHPTGSGRPSRPANCSP